jgi:hypothetical protein
LDDLGIFSFISSKSLHNGLLNQGLQYAFKVARHVRGLQEGITYSYSVFCGSMCLTMNCLNMFLAGPLSYSPFSAPPQLLLGLSSDPSATKPPREGQEL